MDAPIGVAAKVCQHRFPADQAVGDHKGREYPLGVLPAQLLRLETNDCDDDDLYVQPFLGGANRSPQAGMDPQQVYLPAKKTRDECG